MIQLQQLSKPGRLAGLVFLGLNVLSTLRLAIAPAQAQNLFVANQMGNTIREFSPTGVDLGYFATNGLNGPTGLAFDQSGNLYVSNISGNYIRKFSLSGADLGIFALTVCKHLVAWLSTRTATSTSPTHSLRL